MLGEIQSIVVDESGFEYGIIRVGRNRYRFDSRNTCGVPMSEFYKGDCVEFETKEINGRPIAADVRLAELSNGQITYFNKEKGFGKIDGRLFFHYTSIDNFDDYTIDTKRFVYDVSFCETVNPEKDNSPVAIGIHIHDEVDKSETLCDEKKPESSETVSEFCGHTSTRNIDDAAPSEVPPSVYSLTEEDIDTIRELLHQNYISQQTVSLVDVGNYLNSHGIYPSNYGYPKLRPLLHALTSFITVEDRTEDSGSQSYATFSFEHKEAPPQMLGADDGVSLDSDDETVLKDVDSLQQIADAEDRILDYFEPGFSHYFDREKAYEKYLKPGSGEDIILDKLSKVLRIARIGNHDVDQRSKYQFCVAGATRAFKQYISGKHEFLIIFSHFDSTDWQSKTLSAERAIRQRHEIAARYPLVNFYILISNARTLRAEIDAKKGGTTSAIIPFSFEELLTCKDKQSLTSLMLSRFDEYYFENNMLGETAAIDDDNLLFGDRGKIADTIAYRCKTVSYSGIFGLRRSGKSSVLNAVFRRLERENIRYIKIESGSDLEQLDSWKTALYDIAKKVRQSILGITQEPDESRSEFLSRLKLNSTEEDYQKRAAQYFVEDIKLYCKNEPAFVIALDEVEKITYNTSQGDAWQSAAAFCGFWGALRDCGCAIIICGVNPTIDEINTVSVGGKSSDNPMRGRIKNCAGNSDTYLPSFTDEQTKYMINMLGSYSGIAFSNVYQEINRAFGGQPYAIRQFCSFVFEKVKSFREIGKLYEVSKATVENLLIEFGRSAPGYRLCEDMLQHIRIFPEEYKLLCDIATAPEMYRKMTSKQIQQIDHLVKYGLIDWDSATNYISFRIHIIQDYLSEKVQKDPRLMSNDERRRYVQDNVANCERKLKSYLRNYYVYTRSEADCRKFFTNYIKTHESKDRRVRISEPMIDPNTCGISDFFDHKKLVLYFSSLTWIIANNWNTVGASICDIGITKEKFISSMADLNAGRTDADHYDAENVISCPEKWEIDDQTIQSFTSALTTMENIFKKCL